MRKPKPNQRPSAVQLETELKRMDHRRRFRAAVRSTVCTLLVVAAGAVLVASLWLPVLRIYGGSMAPTLESGEIVLCVKTRQAQPGDVLAFRLGNKILIKRVIAQAGDQVDIGAEGQIFVNGQELAEPYISRSAAGDGDIALPFSVPEGSVFVLGDHRETSVDSRHSAVGCVTGEQIVGKLIFRVWPLDRLGSIQ